MTDQKKQGPRRYKKRLRKGRAFFSLVMILSSWPAALRRV